MKFDKFVFKRNEIKYKLSIYQYDVVVKEIARHLCVDKYGETTIQSLYYDTDTWLLIRNSIEKPLYKEKIRARSYGLATKDKEVFLELKKKCDKVVYKRRINILGKDLDAFLNADIAPMSQIEKEIRYFCDFYGGLKPSMLLLYDRTAYVDAFTNSDLRITFDKNIRYRTDRLNLHTDLEGTLLLPNEILMEVKTSGAYPRWLISLLNENGIYKTSFSKYGTAYLTEQAVIHTPNTYTEDKII